MNAANSMIRLISQKVGRRNPLTYTITMDEAIGLDGEGPFEARRLHPSEEILGHFKKGESVKVIVPAFRAYAMIVSSKPSRELGVAGCSYEVLRDVPGKPAILKLLGMPGTSAKISLPAQPRKFTQATLGKTPASGLLAGESQEITFPGHPGEPRDR